MLFSLGPGEEHVFLESVYLSFCKWHLAGEGGDNNIGSMWLMGAWEDSRSSLVGSPLQGPLGRRPLCESVYRPSGALPVRDLSPIAPGTEPRLPPKISGQVIVTHFLNMKVKVNI